MSEPVVHVIDDDEGMRRSLAFLLKSAGLSAKTYESATDFLTQLPAVEAGCIVTDVRMPQMSGLDLARLLKERQIAHPIIMITGHGDVPLAVEAMKAGVVDFLEKPFDDEMLIGAIRTALAPHPAPGGRSEQADRHAEMIAQLSPRERDVLRGVLAGKPNKIIAFDLGISPRTVEVYRANVMTKSGAGSLSELVRMALLAGFF